MKEKGVKIIGLIIAAIFALSASLAAANYDETVYQAQKKLKELGYNSGPLDGIWGSKTETAIKKFQQDKGLPITGKLDEGTKEKLGLQKTPAVETQSSLPQWLPKYPSVRDSLHISSEGNEIVFITSDSASKVVEFYSEKLKTSGFSVDDSPKSSRFGAIGGSGFRALKADRRQENEYIELEIAVLEQSKNSTQVVAKWTTKAVLITAVESGDTAQVESLLAKGADVNAKDEDGRMAFMFAAGEGHPSILEVLLAKGADVNAKDKNDRTALFFAASKGHPSIVKALLAKGADVNAKDKDGRTALHYATEGNHKEVIEILQQASTAPTSVGDAKNDVLDRFGRPRNWVTFTPDQELLIHTVYSLNSVKRPMPSDEIWIFEYKRPDGTKFSIHLKTDRVTSVVEGGLLKEVIKWKSV